MCCIPSPAKKRYRRRSPCTTPVSYTHLEGRTFICTRKEEDAGPTNNWMDPKEAYEKLGKLFDGAMKDVYKRQVQRRGRCWGIEIKRTV